MSDDPDPCEVAAREGNNSPLVPPLRRSGGGVTTILLLSGPNLNLLGQREPEIYGTATLDDHVEAATKKASDVGIDLNQIQSNHEGEIVDAIQHARTTHDAIIINPGAFSHYAWAIHDALASF